MSTGVFNSLITRADADSLIPTQDAESILKLLAGESAALSLFRRVRMSSKTFRQPVLSALTNAYWVNGDTGIKQTTDVMWDDAELVAEEIAAIVPIPDAVVSDAGYPIWDEVKQAVAEAVAVKLDQAVLAGVEKPATWPTALAPAAIAALNTHTAAATPDTGGIADDMSAVFDLVENDGFDVSAVAAKRSLRSLLRRARDTSGQKLMDVSTTSILEAPVHYCVNGTLPADVLAIAGQFDLAILGVRQDLTWKLLDQAVITDDTGAIILNLAQQDSSALRVVARFGYAVATPISRPEAGSGTPFPFAVLRPTGTP
jgi:HK97 family phage major capsid protein